MMRSALLLLAVLPGALAAQGTIGGQGFGYPAGQYSARAMGTGGALGPFDLISPINPAAIAPANETEVQIRRRGLLFVHLEPEFRSTKVGGATESTHLSRFPLAGGSTRVGGRGAVELTFSTYLDRTWETAAVTPQTIDDQTVDLTTRYASDGAISDIRFAFGWLFGKYVQAGVAYHAYTGENRMAIGWDFPDTTPFGDVSQQQRLTYTGRGVSAGAIYNVPSQGSVSLYGRWGGGAKLRANDTLIATAHMPDHLGVAVRYIGLRGTTFAAGYETTEWTAMRGLGSPDLGVRDTRRLSVGLETTGPSIGRNDTYLRLGFLDRVLPFDPLGAEATEKAYAFGVGAVLPFGNFDMSLQRAIRSAASAREHAWLFTFGLSISP